MFVINQPEKGPAWALDSGAIVNDEETLTQPGRLGGGKYQQHRAVVEEFLPGREFTVAVLGRGDSASYSRPPEWFAGDGFHRFPILEVDNASRSRGNFGYKAKTRTMEKMRTRLPLPGDVEIHLAEGELQTLAIPCHLAIGATEYPVSTSVWTQKAIHAVGDQHAAGLTPDFSDHMCHR
jgi:D-alanine-D-alanine ligase